MICGICWSSRLELVLSLGMSPPPCSEGKSYPLELMRCEDCSLVQLSVAAPAEDVFPPDYSYSSGNSAALRQNFADLERHADYGTDDLVVDIGANDGTLLSSFTCRTVGIEPTGQARKVTGPAYQEFFTEDLAYRIRAEHGPAKVITACNVLAHVADIEDVMRGIKALLAPDGVLIAENHDLLSVVDGRQWDTVYHEHLRFYDPFTFYTLLATHGLSPQRWDLIHTHGGSFRMFAHRCGAATTATDPPPERDYDFDGLARDAEQAREAIRAAATPGTFGIGATARATTIVNYCDLDLECVCEVPGSDKIGHAIPGTTIPVVDEERLFTEQPPRALLLSWHLADLIVPKLRERGYEGEIVLPLPTVAMA